MLINFEKNILKRYLKMTYSNFKNKHLEEALFNPQDYINWSDYY